MIGFIPLMVRIITKNLVKYKKFVILFLKFFKFGFLNLGKTILNSTKTFHFMKKITLLLTLFFCAISGYGQTAPLSEGFESGIPADWKVMNGSNGLGSFFHWEISTTFAANSGTKAAFVNTEEIGINNTEEDWLISRANPIPAAGQLRFFTRQTIAGDQNTLYQIRVALVGATPNQETIADYAIVKQWTETELSNTASVGAYVEKTFDMPAAYVGQNVYIAFVRVFTQPGTARAGDRWLIDDVRVVPKCQDPAQLNVDPATLTATSATLSWQNPGASTSWEVEIVPANTTPTGTGAVVTTAATAAVSVNTSTIALYNPLNPGVSYEYYVRSLCADQVKSEWVGPFIFTTLPIGAVCANPINIAALPYQTGNNTAVFGNHYAGPQGAFTSCGATPAGTNYFGGADVFYSYTATATGPISIAMAPLGAASTNSSIFVYNGPCSNVGTACLAGLANADGTVRNLTLNVIAGNTYLIVISSSAATPTVAYNLLIQQENCSPKPADLTATDPTLVGATLSWGNAGNYTSWDVAVQPLGQGIPTGAGTDTVTGTPSFIKTGLAAGTQYQYWVRAECTPGSGIYTAWAGPFVFNTQICAAADQCNFTFRMTDTGSNGWNGARMQVRQNGIVVATIGSTFGSGAGPVNVTVPLCAGVPFDLFWSVAGTAPAECVVSIINPSGQTIFVKAAGTGAAGAVVYSDISVNCAALCNIAPESVSVSNITTTGATINWVAPATSSWDIYIYPVGSPAPTPTTVPTYAGVTTNGFATTIPLPQDTDYNVCVRVTCSPSPSPWTCTTFATLPTCPQPLALSVPANAITTTSANLNWTPAANTNLWEILLVASIDPPAAPTANPVLTPGSFLYTTDNTNPSTFTATNLAPATIYYYYIRTVCAGDDKSRWIGPVKFNTTTCATADKCDYKFVMTDTGANGWEGARMQVRQNGIVVANLGISMTGSGPTTVTVKLCPSVPFDLFWNIAGNAPQEVGVQIQTPFADVLYTKNPGSGTPLTVLYSNTNLGNCTPPSCPKPTAMDIVANSISQTQVQLTWTMPVGSTVTQWEVYAAPVGSPLPVNGTPLNTGVANYYLVNGPLPYLLTGLTPGTAYTYYVRAICSASDFSTWTILNPKSFTTKPLNDECASATTAAVNPVWECNPALNTPGNTLGATFSGPATGCASTAAGNDIWFKFTAVSTIQTIDFNNVVITGGNVAIAHAVFSGACDGLTQMYCIAKNESIASGLVPGQEYYIRVYPQSAAAGLSASFNLCIGTPPPPATNNECADAINVAVNSSAKCTLTTAGNIIGATASPQPSTCAGSADDDVWFTFTALSTEHYISITNVLGTTTLLNHAVYTGDCGNLTLKYCNTAGALASNSNSFVVGQTYYIRVWSASADKQIVTFDVCIRSVSTCDNAEPFCGSSIDDPYIYDNTTGITNGPAIACLGSSPNPTYYTLHVGQSGNLTFNISQNTAFDDNGLPIGDTLDVDYVTWGPFTSADPSNCNDISFAACTPSCPNNTSNPNFYPFGNIVDCSFDGSFQETLHIPNAQAGEYYVVLVTNYSNRPGRIRVIQENFGEPGEGETICCDVDLGDDISVCAENTLLNALTGVQDLANVPDSFDWFFNGVAIPGESGPTYLATASGTYKVTGNCGLNPVESEIQVILGPIIQTTTPADYVVCDDAANDGFASFDLATLTPQVLGALDAALYTVTYYLTPEAAAIGAPGTAIDITGLFTNTIPSTQIIYIRVQSVTLATCYSVVPVNLVVTPLQSAAFTYGSIQYCKDAANPTVILPTGSVIGQFTATPAGLSIDASTGTINLAASTAGDYVITNTLPAIGGCGIVTAIFNVKITEPIIAEFNFGTGKYCKDGGTVTPIFSNPNAGPGTFTATPAGLAINPTTGAIDLANSDAGTYQVTNTIPAAGGCQADINFAEVIVTEPATGSISYETPFCKSAASGEVIGTFTPGGVFTAASGLSIDATTGTINPVTSTPGDYIVVYTIPAFEGCSEFTAETPVTISAEAAITFTAGCDSNDFVLQATPSDTAGTYTYSWSGPSFEPGATPDKIIVSGTGLYSVTITNADGCQTTENKELLDILCDIQRGISPNNDGNNESFDLTALGVRHLSIFNRYGTQVYQLSNYTDQWHGQTHTGEELPDGTYFYVIEKNDGKNKTGWIYINR